MVEEPDQGLEIIFGPASAGGHSEHIAHEGICRLAHGSRYMLALAMPRKRQPAEAKNKPEKREKQAKSVAPPPYDPRQLELPFGVAQP